MSQFYLFLWLRWALRVTLSSVALAAVFSAFITAFIYIKQGLVPINLEVLQALLEVFIFWFPLVWSITLLVSLFRSLKHVFNVCISGYQLKLLECNSSEGIEVIGYGDLVKVWRKWFMLMIWLSAIQMIFALAISYVFSSSDALFDWFNIYILFLFILISGYISFILLGSRCNKVKVIQC